MSNLQQQQARDAVGQSEHFALLLLPALFAAGGCASLIYQVVWFQMLSLAIGASAVSLAVLLATFLGGLCLGSLLHTRIATHRHPLLAYALLELGIGWLGIVILVALPFVGSVYTSWGGDSTFGVALRLAAAAICVLPSTILMGATLPTVARWAPSNPRGVAWIGGLYAANTAGAVIGSLAAGFWLLRLYDVRFATVVAAALNLGVAVTATWLARRTAPVRQVVARAVPPASSIPWPVYITTTLSGMTALSAEVLWTRHLSLLLGSTVYTFALILAVFLFGIGVGGAVGANLGRRSNPGATLGWCQWLLCFAMAWAAYAIAESLPYWPLDVALPSPAAVAFQIDLLRTAFAVLPAALLWGASFTLALAAASAGADVDSRRTVAMLYAANTAGAIAGALLTTFVLVGWLGSQTTQQLAILTAAFAGLLMLIAADRSGRRGRLRAGALALVLGAIYVAVRSVPSLPPALVAYGRFMPTRGVDANVVYVGEGLTASIAVTREADGTLTYHNAGKTQASTYPQDLRLQRMLGHLATLVPERPASALVIGLGAGITAGAVSIDPTVERVVVAELEPLVPHAAAEYFGQANFGVVANPKVTIHIDDGRHFLATTHETFDAITSDPLDPWVKGAAALYTREFWRLCKTRLNDGGVVTVFLQLYETTPAAVKSEIATFLDVFPNGVLFANTVDGMGYDAVLFARKGDGPIDIEHLQQRFGSRDDEHVARSLRQAGFASAFDLLGTYAGQASDMSDWLARASINTDRNLRLQYLAGEGLNVYRAADVLREILPHGTAFPDRVFTGSPAQLEELRQRLLPRQAGY